MAGLKMAKKKPSERSPKNKERKGPGFRTIGFRASMAFSEWADEAAKYDRVTVAAFIEKAMVDRAKAIGFEKKPPERIP